MHPNCHAVRSEEVVAGPSKLTIDGKVAATALEDLVAETEVIFPGSTVRTRLGRAWFSRLVDMSPCITC